MGLPWNFLALALGDLAILAVGALTWRRNYHSGAARAFFITTLSFAFWLTANYFTLQQDNFGVVNAAVRLSYVGGVWIAMSTWFFCFRFPNERKPKTSTLGLFIFLLVAGSLFSFNPLVAKQIYYRGQQLIITPGPAYALYGVLIAAWVIAAMVNLKRNYSSSDLLRRNQVRYAAFGISLGASLSIFFNVFLVLFDARWGSPLINLLITLVMVIFLGYGLIRHRYTDVHRLVSWLFTYVVCIGLIAGWFLLATIALLKLYPGSGLTQSAGFLVSATIAIFAIQPIKRRVKLWADQLLDVGWYDSQIFLNTIGTMLAGELRLNTLLKNSLQYICTELQVTMGELAVMQTGKNSEVEQFGTWASSPSNEAIAGLPKTNHMIIADELSEDNHLLQRLEQYGIRISVPLETRGRRVGYLFLGVKQHGDIFTSQDTRVLQILSSQLAVAIVSAQEYEQISHFNDTLQQEVNQATADLRKAHEKLKLDDRMKTEFIMLTSHNLRTPLTIIKGFTNLLEEGDITKEQAELLHSMKIGTDKLSQFVEDLLTIDSIVAGNQLELSPVSVKDALLPLVKEAQEFAKAKQLEFKAELGVKDQTINANLPRLSGAIRNILDNAFKFTKHGNVTLVVKTSGSSLHITVTDTGIGIPPDELPNLFSKFHRASGTVRYDYDGEGIGLYLANLIIKEHSGSIKVKSRLNQGSSFTVTLPLKK